MGLKKDMMPISKGIKKGEWYFQLGFVVDDETRDPVHEIIFKRCKSVEDAEKEREVIWGQIIKLARVLVRD